MVTENNLAEGDLGFSGIFPVRLASLPVINPAQELQALGK